MPLEIHVNGPAVIKAGIQGPAGGGTPDQIGITENGPHIAIDFHTEPVIADTGGTSIPVDEQEMGKSATITFQLPIYDLTTLTSWFLNRANAGSTEGRIPALGRLLFGNNKGFRLIISSPTEAQPWRFFYCKVDYARLRPGTKYNVYDVGISAIAYIGTAVSPADKDLYDHTDA